MKRRSLFLLMSAISSAAWGEGESVTPYRPTVSIKAALSAPGWIELEAGLSRAAKDRKMFAGFALLLERVR